MYLLFCKASDCFPYGLHIAGRTYVFMRCIFFITSAKARTIFSCPPSVFRLSSELIPTPPELVQAPLCKANRSLLDEDRPEMNL